MSKIFRFKPTGTAIAVTQDRHGSATKGKFITGEGQFESELFAEVRDKNGRLREVHEYFGNRKEGASLRARIHNKLIKIWYLGLYGHKTKLSLGSGLTTNVAALATAFDYGLPNPTTAINIIKLANYHNTGTGSTAAAATDIMLTTADAVTVQAGTQSLISAANSQKYQTVATMTGYGTEAVTEWGLTTGATFSATTGTPLTAASSSGGTVTGTPLTASSTTVQGETQHIIVDTTASPNVWGYVTANTTSTFTVPAWYKKTDGTAGTTPGNTDAIAWYQILYDHKVFAAINTTSGDTITFTYQLTVASGN